LIPIGSYTENLSKLVGNQQNIQLDILYSDMAI